MEAGRRMSILGGIDSVAKHSRHANVIVVKDHGGMEISYLLSKGTLIPGRVWVSTGPRSERVYFFLPFPDGQPHVLEVDCEPPF
jgi:hypothetical protein